MKKKVMEPQKQKESFVTEMATDEAPARRPQHAIIKSNPQWLEVMGRIERDDLEVGRTVRIDCRNIAVRFARQGFCRHLKDYLEDTCLNARYDCWTVKHEEAVYLARKDQDAAVEKLLAS